MDRETILEAVQRVKNSQRIGWPAKLADEVDLIEKGVLMRYVTWKEVAAILGITSAYVYRSRSEARKLNAKIAKLNALQTEAAGATHSAVSDAEDPEKERTARVAAKMREITAKQEKTLQIKPTNSTNEA